MSDEAEAAAKDQQRIKGDNTIPQGGGEGGKKDTTTSPPKSNAQGPASDAAPNLKPAKPGDS